MTTTLGSGCGLRTLPLDQTDRFGETFRCEYVAHNSTILNRTNPRGINTFDCTTMAATDVRRELVIDPTGESHTDLELPRSLVLGPLHRDQKIHRGELRLTVGLIVPYMRAAEM